MSTNPNKLAWKGTPAPYRVENKPAQRHGGINNFRTIVFKISDGVGPYQTVADVYGDGSEQCKANAHLISAAPEAIEFIADLLYAKSIAPHPLDFDLEEDMIARAEEILKKAYNF